jgi:heterodisulfide reductase subunit A-like polyferredoxin
MQAINKPQVQPTPAVAIVVGGGIGGMRSALDLADVGLKVFLVEGQACWYTPENQISRAERW